VSKKRSYVPDFLAKRETTVRVRVKKNYVIIGIHYIFSKTRKKTFAVKGKLSDRSFNGDFCQGCGSGYGKDPYSFELLDPDPGVKFSLLLKKNILKNDQKCQL
jgi:hypothetical protein